MKIACWSIKAREWEFYYASEFHKVKASLYNTAPYTAAVLVSVSRDEQRRYRKMQSGHRTPAFCSTPAYCTNHGFGPELERALDSPTVMMESGDRQYCMNDGFFYDLENTNMDKSATSVVYKMSKTDVYIVK